ncbi:YybH family protein [Novosphingobium taihuense]|uniref:Uncharacterized protein (TIGR02246 family) n=1 Tax=Novosphingobium taihuense TaxID=260085 RepID=A0A7W7EU34_9SPHN|nr:SgcJ/EcaC family oxidoreductase [Novosphingobium taihuense]MBB4613968.1 uncharacterized protein (TIGR02246 family) [Novosphingobium taihuense]TWH86819.1 uncharacterized protein (TIGR02246 family) [Novosphingobium taihuense]
MIGSILRALRGCDGREASSRATADPAIGDITRSGFLKLVAGTAMAAGLGDAASAHRRHTKPKIPPVTDIDKLYDAWQDRMNVGDLEGLVDLYLDDVTYVNPDGKVLHGKAAVREDFTAILALKPQIVLGDRKHLLWRDVALTTNHWRMTFAGPDGKEQVLTGGGIEVMRKQADGGWRYIIDDASRSASK